MKRLLMGTAFSCLVAFSPAVATTMIGDVEVNVDLPAITNQAAATHFAHISDDLKSAIVSLIGDRTAADGSKITIDISEVELSNWYSDAAGTANTKLVGIVHVDDPTHNMTYDSYTLTVDVSNVTPYLPAATDIATLKASSDEYYKAMIQAFAQKVVEKLPA